MELVDSKQLEIAFIAFRKIIPIILVQVHRAVGAELPGGHLPLPAAVA